MPDVSAHRRDPRHLAPQGAPSHITTRSAGAAAGWFLLHTEHGRSCSQPASPHPSRHAHHAAEFFRRRPSARLSARHPAEDQLTAQANGAFGDAVAAGGNLEQSNLSVVHRDSELLAMRAGRYSHDRPRARLVSARGTDEADLLVRACPHKPPSRGPGGGGRTNPNTGCRSSRPPAHDLWEASELTGRPARSRAGWWVGRWPER